MSNDINGTVSNAPGYISPAVRRSIMSTDKPTSTSVSSSVDVNSALQQQQSVGSSILAALKLQVDACSFEQSNLELDSTNVCFCSVLFSYLLN